VGGDVKVARQGETLRYRGDRDHKIVNIGDVDAHATMILMMKVPMAE
jgi:hypothetical protein